MKKEYELKNKVFRNRDYLALHEVMMFVQECLQEGYEVPPLGPKDFLSQRVDAGVYDIKMVKFKKDDTCEEEDIDSSQEESQNTEIAEQVENVFDKLAKNQKKEDLLSFAMENNIRVPETVRRVAQIRKYIKDELERGDNESQV